MFVKTIILVAMLKRTTCYRSEFIGNNNGSTVSVNASSSL
jgi:hypothetical protein